MAVMKSRRKMHLVYEEICLTLYMGYIYYYLKSSSNRCYILFYCDFKFNWKIIFLRDIFYSELLYNRAVNYLIYKRCKDKKTG